MITMQTMFPSPYGELHFSMRTTHAENKSRKSFRPLTGNYISQYKKDFAGKYVEIVSVPLRGITFLNMLAPKVVRM